MFTPSAGLLILTNESIDIEMLLHLNSYMSAMYFKEY